jgi:hypothetical protein
LFWAAFPVFVHLDDKMFEPPLTLKDSDVTFA